ncbi:WD repeat-containing 61 [Gossypium arboreum]|uniref:WD repeat-containing 61 n=1 Tax=Gossypium arboreum TaxID=29729 RepID=A0A0B0P875_GOSAR|nr:WD repeat-containing 61 [Gossypium arboreum]
MHTARSKSFAYVADDEELSSGKKVGRLQLFDIPHKKKDGSPLTTKATEIMEKLKDKRAEYEAIASSDSSVNLDDIDNQIITKVLGLKRYSRAQAEVQRLKDQMAKMQVSAVEQIAQLKIEATSREAEAQRKYEELQLQLKAEAVAKKVEASRIYDEL